MAASLLRQLYHISKCCNLCFFKWVCVAVGISWWWSSFTQTAVVGQVWADVCDHRRIFCLAFLPLTVLRNRVTYKTLRDLRVLSRLSMLLAGKIFWPNHRLLYRHFLMHFSRWRMKSQSCKIKELAEGYPEIIGICTTFTMGSGCLFSMTEVLKQCFVRIFYFWKKVCTETFWYY